MRQRHAGLSLDAAESPWGYDRKAGFNPMKIRNNSTRVTTRTSMLVAGSLITAWLSAGCAGSAPEDGGVMCGPGTVEEEGLCVPESSTGGGPSASSSGNSSSNSSGGGGGSSGGSGGSGSSGDCINGTQQPCYGGPDGTQDVGACHTGTQTCSEGTWGPCVGEVTPSAETCDGIDNTCDGTTDEGLGTLACGVGQCATTAPACENGQPGACIPGAPSPETCDGIDNNCDGQSDEGNPGGDQACSTGNLGACAEGKTACVAGATVCNPVSVPSLEACNGIDDDCNGVADEGNPGGGLACSTGLPGVCDAGTTECAGGQIACNQDAQPSAESCDGIDNNCDGVADDGCSPGPASYQTEPGYFDAVLDTERHQVFFSYGGSGVVRVIDLFNGSGTIVTTGWNAEHMHFDPILDQVVISLPSAAHSSYWWDEEQEGYVAAINAVSLANPTPIWIPLDPWEIVSDGSGYVYAGGASGQWTSAISVNLATGWSALSGGTVRQGTNIRIHPSLNRVYGADNGLSPSDIERWNIVPGKITPSYDSPYHGNYPMCGDLRIHPAGNTIYTRCGHVFLASNVQGTDMTWVANMGISWTDLTFHPSGSAVYAITNNAPVVYEYDPTTLTPVTTHPLAGTAQRILAGPTYLVVLRNILNGNPKTQIEVIPYDNL
jgi:hypothetical protein